MHNQESGGVFHQMIRFFDRLEDHVRSNLSRRPITYSMIGGVAIVLFWRGIWMVADEIGLSGLASVIISVPVMLITGLFVSFFVGDRILLSGLRHEKKLMEKTEEEVQSEFDILRDVRRELNHIERKLASLEGRLDRRTKR